MESLVGGGAWVMACFPVSGSREPGEHPLVSGPGGSRCMWVSVGGRALDIGHNLSFLIHRDLTHRVVARMA